MHIISTVTTEVVYGATVISKMKMPLDFTFSSVCGSLSFRQSHIQSKMQILLVLKYQL